MIAVSKLISIFEQALAENWGYIYGKTHEMWSAAKQQTYAKENANNPNKAMSCKVGGKWAGHWVTDCSGLFAYAFKVNGGYIAHGSNSMWDKYCTAKGDLVNGVRSDGQELKPGTALYTDHNGDKTHVGLYIGDGWVIEAAGASDGVIKSKASNKKWKCWGELKGVDYTGKVKQEQKSEVVVVLEKAKVKGGRLNLRMSPSTSGTSVGSIPDGSVVEVVKKTNDVWWSVAWNGKTGYVMRAYLEEYNAASDASGGIVLTLTASAATELYNELKKALGK